MNALDLQDISYRFPGATTDVLRHVNWSAVEGSVNLLVGPSGAGKTTLLNCLNGIIPHFHGGSFGGDASLLGTNTRQTAPRDLAASVGSVFQDPESQFVAGGVEDEIVFGMENLGYDRRTMRLRLEETLDLMGIQHLRGRSIVELSGGERQRVALAAALATRPQLLLLDEPTSQLDPLAAHDILGAVERLNLDFGMTVVIAEHRLDRVLPFAEQIVAVDHMDIRHGAVQQMLATLDDVPPLVEFGRHAKWNPLPVTIRDARRMISTETAPRQPLRRPTETGNRVLSIDNVSYRYGNRQALAGISLHASQGEVIALAGKNGSGKTTLLRQIIGLQRPESGRIVVAGSDIASMPVQQVAAHVGYVPQFPTSILHQETVRDEIGFTARARGVDVDSVELAGSLGIRHLLDRHPLDLSGGQRQRAALAAIAAGNPQILLLDEPTRGLSGKEKAFLATFIGQYAQTGRLVIVATHDVEFLAQCATRVLMLADGELIADGHPSDVLSGSLTFSTQMNRLFGGDILTLADAGVTSVLS